MKKSIPLLLVIILTSLIMIACQIGRFVFPGINATATPSQPETVSLVETCQTGVAKMVALTQGLQLPENLQGENPIRKETDFNVNTYFNALERLSMQPGYMLDYVYIFRGLGANPVLYNRPTTQPPFSTYQEYAQALGGSTSEEQSDVYLQHITDFLDQIHVEDSPEGFLQLAILTSMADQFYLVWHSLYNDSTILCVPGDAKNAMQSVQEFGLTPPDEILSKAQDLDYTPEVSMNGDSATVKLVTFTKWGGFIERRYNFSRQFPHRLLDFKEQTLIEYDCGIMF